MSNVNNSVSWDDVEDAAKEMFHVWCNGGELQFAKECWHHLAEKGLTGNSSLVEFTKTQLRLVALARFYREFCNSKWEEYFGGELGLIAEHLEIDPISLGIVAGSLAPKEFDDIDWADELQEQAYDTITRALRPEIFNCLLVAYDGVTPLYSRMSQTNRSPDQENHDNEFSMTGENMRAFNFVENGFRE